MEFKVQPLNQNSKDNLIKAGAGCLGPALLVLGVVTELVQHRVEGGGDPLVTTVGYAVIVLGAIFSALSAKPPSRPIISK